jgi:SAM-dependent methyltransferase
VDIGCGTGRHRRVIERAGYQWLGVDIERRTDEEPFVQADCRCLPLEGGSAAAVVMWQVLEQVDDPETALAEACRVLEIGGVIRGTASFPESVQGPSRSGFGRLALEEALRRNNFLDVRLVPGMKRCGSKSWRLLPLESAGHTQFSARKASTTSGRTGSDGAMRDRREPCTLRT